MDLSNINSDLSALLNSENGCQYTDISDCLVSQTVLSDRVSLNVLHLNIRSFHRNKDSLTMLLDDLQQKGVVVQVIGLCETFLSSETSSLAKTENYRLINKFRSD